jgi:hypothetical protein
MSKLRLRGKLSSFNLKRMSMMMDTLGRLMKLKN